MSSSQSTSTDTLPQISHPSQVNNRTSSRACYVLAHPAPVFTDKAYLVKRLRPRLHLQLQRPSQDGRHYEPVIDVMSHLPLTGSQWMVSGLKRCVSHLTCKLTSHETHRQTNKHNVVLLDLAENGATLDTVKHNGVHQMAPSLSKHTKVVATLRDKIGIVMENGQTWTASTRPNRSFEFTTSSSAGEKSVARWVPARKQRPGAFTASSPPPSPWPEHPAAAVAAAAESGTTAAYHFSLIHPTTRRHAVLATLSPHSLVVKETYHEPKLTPGGSTDDGAADIRVVDRTTRTLILVTAVWLYFNLGWSPSYDALRT